MCRIQQKINGRHNKTILKFDTSQDLIRRRIAAAVWGRMYAIQRRIDERKGLDRSRMAHDQFVIR